MSSKANAEINFVMPDRLLENLSREIFKNIVLLKDGSWAQTVLYHKCVLYTCSMKTVQQNGGITLFST